MSDIEGKMKHESNLQVQKEFVSRNPNRLLLYHKNQKFFSLILLIYQRVNLRD